MNSRIFENPDVAAVFEAYPKQIRKDLMHLRGLILETGENIEGLGKIEETLKWGEPSYLTPESRSGSTVRIDWKGLQVKEYAIYFKCTANLVPAFKNRYPEIFKYDG